MTESTSRLAAALADRYRIERELGAGGMATVYLAEDLKHDRKVAVKVLRADLAASLGPERFLREVKIAANLTHPHILGLHDSGQADGFLYYVMPFVEGISLRQKLIREGELPIADAVRILRDVADALAYAHQHGVVHRDIKPENVMLSGRHALVTDFGVAKAVSEATGRQTLTTAGVALGTPAYMAPEQAAADPHTDHRADIYAFGVVAYELLTGRPPFTGASPQAILAAHVTTAADPVTKFRASIPPALAALVMRCLEKKPADRWQSADELIPALEAVLTPSGGMTPTYTQPFPGVSPRRSRLWMAAAVVLVVVLAAIGWRVIRRPPSPAPRIERLAVIPFENRTGKPEHDELGAMVADWITRGLVDARLAEVVPTQVVAAAIAKAREQPNEAMTTHVAQETGATKLVSGAYYAAGDSLRFQAELIDAAGNKSLATVEPVTVLPAAAMGAIEQLRRRTLGVLALRLDPVWGQWAERYATPPSMEAYRAYVSAGEAFFRDMSEAERLAKGALEIDSTYQAARLYLAVILVNEGQPASSDSVLRLVEASRSQLGSAELQNASWLRAELDGDRDAAYRSWTRDSAILGDGADRMVFGFDALKINRPREALRTFTRVNPRSLEMSGIPHFWFLVASAHHMVGDHAAELTAIRQGREQHPRSFMLAQVEAATLAALGRHDELSKLDEEARNLPPERGPWSGSYGGLLSDLAAEFTVHGDSTHGQEFANQAAAWYAAQPVSERNRLRYEQVLTLFQAGRLPEAVAVLEPKCTVSYEGLYCLGWTGVLAARRGDTALARHQAEVIEALELKPRALQSHQAYWLAAIASARGDLDTAMEQLRQSFSKGGQYGVSLRRDPLFVPLHASPAFKELLRPKG